MLNIRKINNIDQFELINNFIVINQLQDKSNTEVAELIILNRVEGLMQYSTGTLKNYIGKAKKLNKLHVNTKDLKVDNKTVYVNFDGCDPDAIAYLTTVYELKNEDPIETNSELYTVLYGYKGISFSDKRTKETNIYLLCSNIDLDINSLPKGKDETRYVNQKEDEHIYDMILTTLTDLNVEGSVNINLVCKYHTPSNSNHNTKEDTAFIMNNFLSNNENVKFNLIANNWNGLISSFEGFNFSYSSIVMPEEEYEYEEDYDDDYFDEY